MNKDSKILIAGNKGMVGTALTENLQSKGYNNISGIDRDSIDLREQQAVRKYFDERSPEYVLLAAAKVGGILANNTYKAEFIYDNIMIAANVINSSKECGVNKLLNLGSSCVYPKFAEQPMREEMLLTGVLEATNEAYAIAKIAAIKLCRYYNEQYGTDYISVMPTNLYGGADNYNLETSHVLPALIRKTILAKKLSEGDFEWIINDIRTHKLGFGIDAKINYTDMGSIIGAIEECGISRNRIELWGSGKSLREFLHVKDMAEACVYLVENFTSSEIGEFINIGSGEEISIADLAALIKEIITFKGEIIFDRSKPDGTPRKLMDNKKIRSLDWKPQISLYEGIKYTFENYMLNV
jgi:GDP-L-fucose synthase